MLGVRYPHPLRLPERPVRRRHLDLRTVEELLDREDLYPRVLLLPARGVVLPCYDRLSGHLLRRLLQRHEHADRRILSLHRADELANIAPLHVSGLHRTRGLCRAHDGAPTVLLASASRLAVNPALPVPPLSIRDPPLSFLWCAVCAVNHFTAPDRTSPLAIAISGLVSSFVRSVRCFALKSGRKRNNRHARNAWFCMAGACNFVYL